MNTKSSTYRSSDTTESTPPTAGKRIRRGFTRASQTAIDLVVLAGAFVLAFLLRFDWTPPTDMIGRLLLIMPYVAVLQYAVLHGAGVTRFAWRYVGLREVGRILAALVTAGFLLLVSRIAFEAMQSEHAYLRHGLVPFSVIAIDLLLAFLGVTGVRVVRRLLGEEADKRVHTKDNTSTIRTMLVGAGQAGVMVAKELTLRPEVGLTPVGFCDDDVLKRGSVVHGVPVLGTTEELAALCAQVGAEQILITMANVPGHAIRRIRELAREAGIPAKIIPGIYELVGGQVNLSRIRDVAIEDLLRRDPIELDNAALGDFLTGRNVLVSGAGGSIGAELCRQIAAFKPKNLILLEQAENALFEIHRELSIAHPHLSLTPAIGDVCDAARVEEIFTRHHPDAVFHAAAHKHVPMMEWNPGEAVKNNIGGSKMLADAAHRHECEAFVMISTDKAVNPTSVMGATKRVAELYVQTLASVSTTRFVTVRFGNVLGSNGSVIPIFKRQIEAGGPISVTHPDMQRYFMTIPEACQLVMQAGSMGKGGEIFILDMGEPVRIVDLARDLIALSGLREGEDIEIVFSGVRPGEKLFEELSTDAEHADRTHHPKIFVGKLAQGDAARTKQVVAGLLSAPPKSASEAQNRIREIVPEYILPPSKDESIQKGVEAKTEGGMLGRLTPSPVGP